MEECLMKKLITAFGAVAALTLAAGAAQARPADCTVSGGNTYVCDFTQQDGDGSFTITARGKDTYILVMNGDNTAFGFLRVRGQGRNVALPGTFIRNPSDTACWVNDATQVSICVRARAAPRR
jgi:hypothetical protein